MPIPDAENVFIDRRRIAHLATADGSGAPHVIPICFVCLGDTLYTTIDQKPKQQGIRLKRLANIEMNPMVSVVLDHYDEDWSRLGWVMLKGKAEILEAGGDEHGHAQAALKVRYPQYRVMDLAGLPVIAVRIEQVASWGNLSVDGLRQSG